MKTHYKGLLNFFPSVYFEVYPLLRDEIIDQCALLSLIRTSLQKEIKNQDLRPVKTQTSLLSYTDQVECGNFICSKFRIICFMK